MNLSQKELAFKQHYENSISKYSIPVTFKELLKYAENKFIENINNKNEKTIIDIGMEREMCKRSAYYFISNYTYISIPGYGKMPTNLYYFQSEILKTIMNYNKAVTLKTRQCGASTLISLLCYWKAIFFGSEWIIIVSKDAKSSQDFLERIRSNSENIPLFCKTKKTINNVNSLKFDNGSKVEAFARSKTAGRGTSPSLVVLDECAFFQTNSIIQGIVGSVQASLAKTGGKLICISTPNGSAEGSEGWWYYEQVQQLLSIGGVNEKDQAILFPIGWWEVPDTKGIPPYKGYNEKLNDYIKKDYFNNPKIRQEANAFFMPIAKDWKNNDWLRRQHETLQDILYRQEILADFVVTGQSVFSAETLADFENKINIPLTKEPIIDERYIKDFWMWKTPHPEKKYALGVDVSSGAGKDSSAIEVIDVITYEQVAEFIGQRTPIDLAKLIYSIANAYNGAYVIIESNSIGLTTFSELYYNMNYNNIFKTKKSKNGITQYVGFETTMKSRELITHHFLTSINEETCIINSSRLLGQMKNWVYSASGRIDHKPGQHDDAIMAFAIALFHTPDAMKENFGFFIDEEGQSISGINLGANQFDNITSLNNQFYTNTANKLLEETGTDSLNTLKWLYS